MSVPPVQIDLVEVAKVGVGGHRYRLETEGSCVWITGGVFRISVEAAQLEDTARLLAAVVDRLAKRATVGEASDA
jgi:hypothetical protein